MEKHCANYGSEGCRCALINNVNAMLRVGAKAISLNESEYETLTGRKSYQDATKSFRGVPIVITERNQQHCGTLRRASKS